MRACEIYQNNIGPICSEIEKDKVLDMANNYPLLWIEAAIEKAVLNNSRRLNYIFGILKNWEKHGFDKAERNKVRRTVVEKNRERGYYDDFVNANKID